MVADLDHAQAQAVAAEVDGLAVRTDVSNEADVQALIAQATERFGRVDVLCSNAGIALGGGVDATNADWQRIWEVNLMAHVYGARAVLPQMVERGEGYLLQTASAAGLLSHPDSALYAVTKHAAVSLAEWLSDQLRRQGHPRQLPVPAGRAHADADGQGGRPQEFPRSTARSAPSRWPTT